MRRAICDSMVLLVEPCHRNFTNQFSPSSNPFSKQSLWAMDDQPDFEDVSPLLIIPGEILPCRVLIDSGAAGNFISLHLVENLGCSVHRLRNPVTVRVANGHDIPIGTFARVTFRMRTLCVLGVLHSRPMAQWEAALVKPSVCLWATRKRLLGDGAFFVEAGEWMPSHPSGACVDAV